MSAADPPLPGIDHLVLFAADLDSGRRWCQRTLGVTPAAGGEHPLMGTHNQLLNLSGPAHARVYLELIAINKAAANAVPGGTKRWFDMDDERLQNQVANTGPQLIAWLAALPDLRAGCAALAAQGLDCGSITAASRATPAGLLQWRIALRADGRRLLGGCLPTLIEWGPAHPCDQLPASGLQLQTLTLQHPQAAALQAACSAIGTAPLVRVLPGPGAQLLAQLSTPLGPVTLASRSG